MKRRFVFKKAVSGMTEEKARTIDGPRLAMQLEAIMESPLTEESFARSVEKWLEDEKAHASHLEIAAQYAAWAALSPSGRSKHRNGVLFKLPRKIDPVHLIPVETTPVAGATAFQLHPSHWRHREGFELTDPGTDLTGALDQAHYCIKCHNQGKDCCSTGLKEKDGEFKASVFGVTLAGCPLDEKISEMNVVEAERQRRSARWRSSRSIIRCAPARATASAMTA